MPIGITKLRFFLRDALVPYTEYLQILDSKNPSTLSVNGSLYSINVLSITDSGEGRGNDDEQRIQIRRSVREEQRRRRRKGFAPLFIGFFEKGDVFTAWEPDYALSLKASNGTVYAFSSHQAEALERGCAVYRFKPKYLPRKTSTISLPSALLGFYLENWRALHAATDEDELAAALAVTARALSRRSSSATVKLGKRRRNVEITRIVYPRNPEFTRLVLEAYGHACCICRKQLRLVEAAHIIPHSHDDATDEVSNGLALCAEHHKLYDGGLVTILAGGRIGIDRNRVEHLQNIGQDRGLNAVERLDGRQIRMPADANDRPDDQLLARGARIRMGTGA